MNKEMSNGTLDALACPNERSTGDIEHLVNLRQLSPTPVQLVQLPNGTNAPAVSMDRNTGDTERLESTNGEELNPLSTAPRATPPFTESSTWISSPIGDHQQIEDQYRPMTPREEEILQLYEEGIYRAPDTMKLSGGLWITGDPRGSCSLRIAPIPALWRWRT